MLNLGLVAGEASGDLLGASLIEALVERLGPDGLASEGCAGPRMAAAGCRVLVESEQLAVMGLSEVIAHLPGLLRIRRDLARHFLAHRPDVFVGIDSPDFNLGLERRLKADGVPTIHYVSPTVWAWRQGRVRTIARSVDRVLALFPFEAEFYERHDVDVTYVGHPLADQLPLEPDRAAKRRQLNLPGDVPVVALLPGSRGTELRALSAPFVRTAVWLRSQLPDIRFVAPMVSPAMRALFEQAVAEHGEGVSIQLLDGQARDAMEAADAVLLASGTAALEAMLLKRPMVVAYRVAPLTHFLLKRVGLLKIDRFSLPNLLAGQALVEEFAQDDVIPEHLGPAILAKLRASEENDRLVSEFTRLHHLLRQDASARAAAAVLEVAGR